MGNRQRSKLVKTAVSPLLTLKPYTFDYRSVRGKPYVCTDELEKAMGMSRHENMPSSLLVYVSSVEPKDNVYVICKLRRDDIMYGSELFWRDIGRGDWRDTGGIHPYLTRLIRKVTRQDEEFYLWVVVYDAD